MIAQYDFNELAAKQGFNVRETEKTCRISDILRSISEVGFLRNRLSLYGGTALNFIYTSRTLRLSVDLDFNYRHMDTKDWGQIRTEIDQRIKDLLYKQGYNDSDITIDPSYPLSRITTQYTNTYETRDNFKIETGYMRRIPILKADTKASFKHIGTHESLTVQTPIKEELFANKWCTMLDRRTSRDLFDVYQISKMVFDHTVFRKCAIIESLMQEKQKLLKINVKQVINQIPIDTRLKNLLQTEEISIYDFREIKEQTTNFSKEIITSLTTNETKAIDQFHDRQTFNPNLIDENSILNKRIAEHPAILRTLQKLKQKQNEPRERKDGFGILKGMDPFTAEDDLDTHN